MSGGILLVDKPGGPTSHDVVAMARRGLRTRGIGHAGTLDPMATGLLVLAVGEGRKLLRYLTLDDKRYLATLRLGAETDSLDADGSVVRRAAVPSGLDAARVERALAGFRGVIEQRAPRVSAIKQDGVALHARVRRGEVVEPPLRTVTTHSLEVVAVRSDPAEIDLSVHCGKGFYVRSLARDLALALGTVGHLTALRRTHSGWFAVDDAVPLAHLRQAAQDDAVRAAVHAAMLDIGRALPDAPRCRLDAQGALDARSGRLVALERVIDPPPLSPDQEPVILLDEATVPLALARREADALRVVRGFNCDQPLRA